jgi:hypothetical protein
MGAGIHIIHAVVGSHRRISHTLYSVDFISSSISENIPF